MADDADTDRPVPRYNHASPGFVGAIHDAVDALAKAYAPKSLTQRDAKVSQTVAQAQDADSAPPPSSLGDNF